MFSQQVIHVPLWQCFSNCRVSCCGPYSCLFCKMCAAYWIIRIITNKGKRDSCRNLYKQLQILTLPSQYIFSLLIFAGNHRDLFLSNSEIHDINIHFNYNLHWPTTNLTLMQKGVLYSGSTIYNYLPIHIKSLPNDPKQFKTKLTAFLLENTCYSLEEFYQITSKPA